MVTGDISVFLGVPAVIMLSLFASRLTLIAIEKVPYNIENDIFNRFVNVFNRNDLDDIYPNEYKKINSSIITVSLVIVSLLLYCLFNDNFVLYFSVSFFTYILFALAMIDISSKYLPDSLNYTLLWSGILIALFNISNVSINDSIFGVILGYFLVYVASKFIDISNGDFKLLAAIGAWLGWELIPFALLGSFILVCSSVPVLVKLGKMEKGKEFAFGQYLALSGWVLTINQYLN